MKKKRVVVTGLGLVSPFGNDLNLFYNKLINGESCVSKINSFDTSSFSTQIAAEIKNFDVENYMNKKQARRVDSFIKYGIVAGMKALENSKLSIDDCKKLNLDRAGIILGSGMGGMISFSKGVETLITKGVKRLTPFFVPYIITNMAGALLAMNVGFKGPNYSISVACATSSYTIISAAYEILNDNADIMICGGAEASICPIGLAGFVAARAISTNNDNPEKASCPWDKKRDGFVMGEGAGILILEELEHAKARNATIYAEYLGGSRNCDAFHMTDPIEDGSNIAKCIEQAIKNANIKKEDVNYINAHATSTIAGDLCEIRAIKKVFNKSELKNIKINATKSITGHCLGAAGSVEAIATILQMYNKKLHPTINLVDEEDEIKDLNIVKEAIDFEMKAAISNSFGFGGHNASIIFAPFKE